MSEIYQLPDSSGNNGNATIPFSIPIGFGGYGNGGMFGNGNGFNSIADLFGLAIIASMFGWGSPSPSTDFLKQKLEDDENKEKEQVFAIPAK